ncbi:hypothetical protein KM620_gp092 [Hyposidra talaca nucleopolyhedrovirus]|uniref:Ac108 n=1 Tax=Hyposidra talaca nucleopolyhedrovirus TaxID=1070315 RepID=A0A2Z4HI74_9ABAC|nr:hypothetical protein KM620_gp092 [Hyposidra talaca nucleopolyhedrovirus]AWW14452.1 hypothetical protein HytaNPV_gp092 [Hyposidra talaca nucleopolyhedrovirus]
MKRTTANTSILDQDQLQQLLSRNQVFLRDFLLVLCAIVIFIILIVFILFILAIGRNEENKELNQLKRHYQYLSNLDYRFA